MLRLQITRHTSEMKNRMERLDTIRLITNELSYVYIQHEPLFYTETHKKQESAQSTKRTKNSTLIEDSCRRKK